MRNSYSGVDICPGHSIVWRIFYNMIWEYLLVHYHGCLQLDLAKTQRDEVTVTCDAYRIAFEEQLNRNRLLLRKFVESQRSKFKNSRQNQKQVAETGDSSHATRTVDASLRSR
jgi:hypothetical protein